MEAKRMSAWWVRLQNERPTFVTTPTLAFRVPPPRSFWVRFSLSLLIIRTSAFVELYEQRYEATSRNLAILGKSKYDFSSMTIEPVVSSPLAAGLSRLSGTAGSFSFAHSSADVLRGYMACTAAAIFPLHILASLPGAPSGIS